MTLHKATSWSKGVISAEARMANLDCLSGSVQGQERAMTEVKPSRKPMVPQAALHTLILDQLSHWVWIQGKQQVSPKHSSMQVKASAHFESTKGAPFSKARAVEVKDVGPPFLQIPSSGVANRSNQWTSPLACPKIPNHLCLSCHRNPLLHVTTTHLYFAQICNFLGEVDGLQIQRTSCIQQSGCEQPISWSALSTGNWNSTCRNLHQRRINASPRFSLSCRPNFGSASQAVTAPKRRIARSVNRFRRFQGRKFCLRLTKNILDHQKLNKKQTH